MTMDAKRSTRRWSTGRWSTRRWSTGRWSTGRWSGAMHVGMMVLGIVCWYAGAVLGHASLDMAFPTDARPFVLYHAGLDKCLGQGEVLEKIRLKAIRPMTTLALVACHESERVLVWRNDHGFLNVHAAFPQVQGADMVDDDTVGRYLGQRHKVDKYQGRMEAVLAREAELKVTHKDPSYLFTGLTQDDAVQPSYGTSMPRKRRSKKMRKSSSLSFVSERQAVFDDVIGPTQPMGVENEVYGSFATLEAFDVSRIRHDPDSNTTMQPFPPALVNEEHDASLRGLFMIPGGGIATRYLNPEGADLMFCLYPSDKWSRVMVHVTPRAHARRTNLIFLPCPDVHATNLLMGHLEALNYLSTPLTWMVPRLEPLPLLDPLGVQGHVPVTRLVKLMAQDDAIHVQVQWQTNMCQSGRYFPIAYSFVIYRTDGLVKRMVGTIEQGSFDLCQYVHGHTFSFMPPPGPPLVQNESLLWHVNVTRPEYGLEFQGTVELDHDLRDIVIASPPAGQEQRFLATNNLTLQWQYGAMCDPSQDNVPGILTFIDETAARTIPHSQMEVNLCAGGATLPALEDWLSTLPHANYPTTLASSRRLTKRQPQDRNVVIRFSLHLRHAHRGHIGGYSNGQLLLLTPTQLERLPFDPHSYPEVHPTTSTSFPVGDSSRQMQPDTTKQAPDNEKLIFIAIGLGISVALTLVILILYLFGYRKRYPEMPAKQSSQDGTMLTQMTANVISKPVLTSGVPMIMTASERRHRRPLTGGPRLGVDIDDPIFLH